MNTRLILWVTSIFTVVGAFGTEGVYPRPIHGVMQGTIQNSAGLPVSGVDVSCWWYTTPIFEKQSIFKGQGEARTAENGDFLLMTPFPPGTTGGYVVTHHPEYGITLTPWQRTNAGLYRGAADLGDIPPALLPARAAPPIVLPDRIQVKGTIRNPQGNPVAGATITISLPIPFRPEGPTGSRGNTLAQRLDGILSTTSGSDGAYVLDGVPKGLLIALYAWHPEAGEASLGTQAGSPDGQPFDLAVDSEPYDLVLPGAGSVLGHVTLPEGARMPQGAFAQLIPMTRVPMEPRNASIDAEGNYAVPALAPGYYQVKLIAPPLTANLASVTVLPGEAAQTTPMSAGLGAFLKGTFKDALTGEIADEMDARIDLVYQDERIESINSAVKNGVFEIVARPGIVTLQVTGINGFLVDEDVEKRFVLKHGTRNEALQFRVSPYRKFAGRVVLPTGEPAAGAIVAVSHELRVVADSGGRFTLPAPPQTIEGGGPSIGSIFGEPPTYLGAANLDTASSDDGEITITVQEPASVSGKLVDLYGKPAAGVPIMIMQSGFWDHGTKSDAQGNFEQVGLIPGLSGLLRAGPSFQDVKEPLQPGERRDIGTVQIDLSRMRAGTHVVIDVPAASKTESNQL